MPYFKVGEENSGSINLYYEDHGKGRPVVLIHGWPLSGKSWEKQIPALIGVGCRVITYDRRGFGISSKPAVGYDYDTLTEDLNKLMTHLDLRDATLVGFSMGGGEVARYLGKYGSTRVSRAVFIGAIPPYLLKSDNNPEGVEAGVFTQIKDAVADDRPAFFSKFLAEFFNFDLLGGSRVSKEVIRAQWHFAIESSLIASFETVQSWLTDFRGDLARIKIPTLVIHGNADRIVPIMSSGRRIREAIPGSEYVEIEGGPHGVTWTHAAVVNQSLVDFIKSGRVSKAA